MKIKKTISINRYRLTFLTLSPNIHPSIIVSEFIMFCKETVVWRLRMVLLHLCYSHTNQNLYGSVNNNIFRVWEQRSQVFIGYGRIPSSTLYDNVEACQSGS